MTQLIFLPGASGDTAFWQPLISLLPEAYAKNSVAYPGFAGEPNHPAVFDFETLSRYVLSQIEQECVIVAQSMGGIFAVQAALQKPKLVKALVLIATSGGIDLTPFLAEDWRSAYRNQYISNPDWFVDVQLDYSAQLSDIKQPVLLLWGSADLISPIEIGKYLHLKFERSILKMIDGGDHLFASKHAFETAALINAFLLAQQNNEG
ncbi:alpha/beta fold hydrolase [Acinetobacter sp. ANC 3813]|uniref:alpha/beta fold hydrolase n=1 Tax=Acinetobacter sp. ANC 3813 TaxID=1977873 RepID=UPI000A3484CA|nr:alpha/beta hydrolase [Acinetobacter sp. ANC 3813]OTG87325.1 alpha/beta hydrolase [Acinetobacter sp. ANC 3813]